MPYVRNLQYVVNSIATLQRTTDWAVDGVWLWQFGGLESLITGFCDEWPQLDKRHELFVLGVIITCFLGALSTATWVSLARLYRSPPLHGWVSPVSTALHRYMGESRPPLPLSTATWVSLARLYRARTLPCAHPYARPYVLRGQTLL